MASELAQIVHRRYGLAALLLAINSGFSIWFAVLNFQNGKVLWIISALLNGTIALMALAVAQRWNLQNILSSLRVGKVIKIVFWLTGLLTIDSGVVTYVVLIEQKNFFWPLLVFLIVHLLALLISMTVRYAIEDDVKKRKVCEFC